VGRDEDALTLLHPADRVLLERVELKGPVHGEVGLRRSGDTKRSRPRGAQDGDRGVVNAEEGEGSSSSRGKS
jgi:hypothetical protein